MSARRTRLGRWALPALIALPFAVAAGYDVLRAVRAGPPADLALLAVSPLEFEPADAILALGTEGADDGQASYRLQSAGFALASGWGETVPAGSWSLTEGAALEIDIDAPLPALLFVEARADRRRREPLALTVLINGSSCGTAPLGRRLAPLRFVLPPGSLRQGANLVELLAVGRPGGEPAEGRTLLVSRLVLSSSEAASFDELVSGPPLVVDRERGTVSIRRAGRLIAPFETPSSGSVVSLQLRFAGPRPLARCRVVVARRFEGPERFDVISERELDPVRTPRARVRQQIPSRGEPSALLVEVNREAAAGGVVLSDLRLEAREPG